MKISVLAPAILAIGMATLPAHAQPTTSASPESAAEAASQRFRRGAALYREGSFDAALAEFTKAYQIAPDYRVLFNIAQVQVQRGDYVAAVETFHRYMNEGGSEIAEQRRSDVEAKIEALRERIATLDVEGNVAGAAVIVDGVELGRLPVDGIAVNAGVRQIVIRKPGYREHTERLTLAGGETTTLTVTLKKDPTPASTRPAKNTTKESNDAASDNAASSDAASDEAELAEPNRRYFSTEFWVSLIATSVAAGGTVTLAMMTRNADDSLDSELNRFPGSSSDIGEARRTLKRDALLTDVCGALTIVGAGVTAYLAVKGFHKEKPTEEKTVSLHTGPMGAGWQVGGTF
jgi:tetratricopeptide (TPR) repeat protein